MMTFQREQKLFPSYYGYIEKPSGRAYGVATLLTQPACLRGHDLASNPNTIL